MEYPKKGKCWFLSEEVMRPGNGVGFYYRHKKGTPVVPEDCYDDPCIRIVDCNGRNYWRDRECAEQVDVNVWLDTGRARNGFCIVQRLDKPDSTLQKVPIESVSIY